MCFGKRVWTGLEASLSEAPLVLTYLSLWFLGKSQLSNFYNLAKEMTPRR